MTFMEQRFERIITTQGALLLMQKFENLRIPNLGIVDKYQRIVAHYCRELDTVAKLYQKNKTDPPIGRDLPPIAGTDDC